MWELCQSFKNSWLPGVLKWLWWLFYRKNMQRNKQVAMGRKKFNMDPKKVSDKRQQPEPVVCKVGVSTLSVGTRGMWDSLLPFCGVQLMSWALPPAEHRTYSLHTYSVCRAPAPILPVPPPPFWVFLASEALLASLLPFQGIQFLIENDLLKNICEDIARFLYKGEGLNKTAIGDYLGER